MPFHHRVNEGLVQCSDCHNVHGSELSKQVRMSSTQDAVCFKCHTDKQGPFVYEHAPVKVDGCEILPHGSRRAEPAHAEGEQRQSALPAVPHDIELQQRAGSAFVPQPGELLPGVHVVPRGDAWFEFQSYFFK